MNKFFALTIFVLFTGGIASAQVSQQTGWLASFNTIKLNKAFSLHAELQVRSTDNWEQVQTILPRVGLNYHFKPNQVFTVGYAYIPNRVSVSGKSSLLTENRVFQQYMFSHKAAKSMISHRLRLEERFIQKPVLSNGEVEKDGTLYSTRLRYFFRGILPFTGQQPFTRGVFGALQNEFFMNISNQDNVNGEFFDQNRAYAAIGYRFSKKLDIEIGYLNQYINRRPPSMGAPNNDILNNVVQLAIYTRL